MARLTGLEPATPGVTGRYSNQLSYNRSLPPRLRRAPNVEALLGGTPDPVKRFCPAPEAKSPQKRKFLPGARPRAPGLNILSTISVI